MTLSPAFLDELRGRTTLSALVGRTTKLQRAGREHRGCCPFHQEKTPSFYVNDEKGFYHCFGCSAHGDAIRWMTDSQGLPFMDAVKELAAAAGMDVPAPDPHAARHEERAKGLHEACQAAADWFEAQLGGLDGEPARALLRKRGITDETRRRFALGYAPDARGKLRTALREFGDDLLVEAGLLIRVEGPSGSREPYDRFRGRLIIPIRDPRGRVIAFGARVIGDGEPKYLNSPDTPLFDKGRTLFNLDRAAPAARKAGRIVVVEGYLDVIALAQAGIDEAVAPLGTALTEAQLERLWRVHDVPIVCLDGDAAGRKAAARAATRALPMLAPGRSLSFVTPPNGQDPDDLVRANGRGAIDALLGSPQSLVDLLWRAEHAAAPLTTPEERAGLRRRLSERARAIADPSVRTEYQAEFRARYDAAFAPSPRKAFEPRRAIGRGFVPRPPTGGDHPQAHAVGTGGIDPVLAKAVVAGLIRHPAEIARHAEVLGSLRLADGALGRLFEAVVDVALADAAPLDSALDSGRLLAILSKSGFDGIAGELLRADRLAYSFCQRGGDPVRAGADLEEAIAVLVAAPEVDRALAEATAAMRNSFSDEAFERQVSLVTEREALRRRLAELMQLNEDARDGFEGE